MLEDGLLARNQPSFAAVAQRCREIETSINNAMLL
jgi:hypothetical protein